MISWTLSTFMALLLLLLNLCSPVVNSALTKETQTYITVDFVNTYSSYEYECTSESSMGSFNVAELHLISATSADYSSFFVTISTSDLAFTLPRACTQYGGGDYIHQGCDISTKSWSTYSSEGLLVTIPIESHHQKHQRAGSGGAMWTICVGSGEAQDSSSSALKAVGNVRLSTSTSKHPLVSNAASKTSTAPRFVETQTERKEKDVKERRNRLAPADDTEHLVLLASEQALSIPSGSKSKTQDDSSVEESQVKAAAAPSTCANVSFYADGYCDNENNVAECDYDGGDCCFEDCTHSQCFHLLESYPKFCHKDETIMVNYLKEHTLTSTDYCGPNFDASTKGARCSLRTAVNFCQSIVVGDHRCIIKIPVGTVELNASSIQLNDNGRSLVIRGDSSATSVVTNTAGGDLRFLYILFASDLSSTTEFVLEHLAITGFSATAGWGGAIYCKYLNKGAFNDLVLVNNNARYGGAMYTNRVDNIAFSSLTFSGNSATEKGGGMYVLSSVDMSATYADMFFDGNSATDDGGGLYISDQDFSISNSIFTGNSASNGGGFVAFNSKNELLLRNVTFTDNTAFSHGGGVYTENIVADIRGVSCSFIRNSAGGNGGGLYFKNNNVMYMADSVISENSAEYGGGVYNYFPGLEVYERVQFLNNDALQGGGGMRGRYLKTTLRDCHVVGNTALWGGGVSISNGNGYHFDADNCSFVENDAVNSGGGFYISDGYEYTVSRSYFSANTASYGAGLVDWYSENSKILDSVFDNNTVSGSGGSLYIDDSLNLHIKGCQMNNNEASYGGAVYMKGPVSPHIESCNFTLNFAHDHAGSIYIGSSSDVVVEQSFFHENYADEKGGAVYIKDVNGIEVVECRFLSNEVGTDGGAIAFYDTGGASISSSVFDGNISPDDGGALYFSSSNDAYTISDCSFVNNEAKWGGSLVDYGTSSSSISNSIFSNNWNSGSGGVIYADEVTDFTVSNCEFDNNYADLRGGAIYVAEFDGVLIESCSMTNNVADIDGGAVYVDEGRDMRIISTNFTNNIAIDDSGAINFADDGDNYFIFNCTFISNIGDYGGAISIEESNDNIIFSHSTFIGNQARYDGGAVFIKYRNYYQSFISCEFRGNHADSSGGAVTLFNWNYYIDFTDCEFHANFAEFGGAIEDNNDDKDVTLQGNLFQANYAIYEGGAVSMFSGCDRWTLDNNTFRENSAENGGAVAVGSLSHNVIISNNLFINNTVSNLGGAVTVNNLNPGLFLYGNSFHLNKAQQGGGIFFSTTNDDVSVENCSFTENFAVNFGGAITFAQGHTGFSLSNSTFVMNTATTSGGAIYFGFSIVESTVTGCWFRMNKVYDYGGGAIAMASFNDIEVLDTIFHDNEAYFGGAIFTLLKAKEFVLTRSSVTNNIAKFGGGLYIGVISEDITLKSVDISRNYATVDGGGIYVDVDSKFEMSDSILLSNFAGSRGGGLYYESDNLMILSSSLESNSAGKSGGALYVTGDNIVISNGTTMERNVVHSMNGGALCLEGAHAVILTNIDFLNNNAAGNGGACYFSDVTGITSTNVSFSRNLAATSGGAVYMTLTKEVFTSEISVLGNKATGTGGGFYIKNCTDVTVNNSSFTDNLASGGSAIWTTESSIMLHSNIFLKNRSPQSGGTVFWEYASGMEEPAGLITSNRFHLNRALYGPDYATEAVGFTVNTAAELNVSETDSYVINEFSAPIVVNAFVHDHYNQKVLSDNTSFIQMVIGDDYDCGDRLPTLSGSTIEKMKNGHCKFEYMYGFCRPGGDMKVKVRGMANSNSNLESSYMKWSFRDCQKGEYYRDGECNWCEQGFYSKKDNLDLSVTECKRCPGDATECFADTIVLDKGYWALTSNSEDMTECPMGENACVGGVQSSSGRSLGPIVGTINSVSSSSEFNGQQQLLVHSALYVLPAEHTTLDYIKVYDVDSNTSICNEGYGGILCAICDEGYYYSPGSNTCEVCEEGGINTFIIVLLCVIGVMLCIPVVLLVLSWTGTSTLDTVVTNMSVSALMYMFYIKFVTVRKPGEDETEAERDKREEHINSMLLRIMPKFKIFISMLQITSSMPAVLGMSFPPFFTNITSIFGLLNLDIVANLGLSCRFKNIDYVDYLILKCLGPMICSLSLAVMYSCHRFMLMSRRVHYEEVAKVYAKYLLVFLMGTYLALPSISVYIFQMFSCQDIDPDDALAGEDLYLRADVSIKCGSPRHIHGITFATLMIIVYPIGVPLMYWWLLHHVKEGVMNRTENISPKLRLAIMPTSFLYSSYEPQFWYWEIVETIRRIMMTGVIVLVAQGTSLQIVVTMLLALFFIKMYSHFTPFNDEILDTDAEFAQYQVFFVLFIALLMKEDSIPSMRSAWGILLVCVIFSLLLLSPLRFLKEKFLPYKFQHLGHVNHVHYGHHLADLKRKELEVEGDDDGWNDDVGINSDSEYHVSNKNDISSSDNESDIDDHNFIDKPMSPKRLNISAQSEEGKANGGGYGKVHPLKVENNSIHSVDPGERSERQVLKYIENMTSNI